MFWNVEEGRGLFIYSADDYPHTHVDSGIFSLISNDIFREGVVCWQKSSYVYIFLNLIKLSVLITNNQQ